MSAANVNVVRELYGAYARRDVSAISAAHAPDIVIYQSELLPWGGSYHGSEGAMSFYGKLVGHVDSRVDLDQIFSAGDRVVAVGRTRGTVRATGRSFEVPVAHVWTLDAGKVTRIEFYIDTLAMLAALQP
jgi:uncharacterized protein